MKNKLFLFLSISLVVGQLQAQTQVPSYVPTNGLVGWWPFNGNANDESGNGNNGTVNGASLTNDRLGNIGKAYSFNGSTNYITIANSSIAAFGSQSFTCSAWIKTSATATANNSGMFVRYDNCVSNSGWGLGFTSYKIIGLEFPTSRVGNTVISANTYNNNSWTQAIFVRDVSQMKDMLYVNGVLLTQTPFSSVNLLSNTGSVLRFGSCAGYQFYSGILDDIGIWNRALTQQEITNLYNSTSPFDISASANQVCAGESVTLTVNALPGTISTLTCASATNNGTLIAGVAASGVNSLVPYNGGNGGLHNGQIVTSTGVTGLTATLSSGTFSTSSGNLTYTITGTPSGAGTANFALNIGGQTCTLSRTVLAGAITTLSCGTATNNGTLIAGVAASGVNSVVPYTGGNGGLHNGQTVTSTGITGLTATLSAGSFASGAGNLTYTITGTPSGSGTANFALNIGGQTCTLSRTVAAGAITTLSCGTATNNGTLIASVAASGVNSVVPYTGGNGGLHNGQTVTSTGITGLTATLSTGSFASGAGNLTYTITGTPSGAGTANFALNIGGQTCTLSRTVFVAGTITALNCASATNSGTLTAGVSASGVTSIVPYTGGTSGAHLGQTVNSTGVTGLTATLPSGTFVVGSGTLTYTITGTATSAGTASFALNIGGRTCTLTRTVDCWSLNNTTTVVEVTNPTTGKTWMDRNLGAVRQATSSTDVLGYGDIYQWGRNTDGHQCRNSLTTTTLSTTDQPATSNFIVVSTTNPGDWRNPQNANLWQGVNGINNPCPSGFRVPTYTELNAELANWTVANAFSSVLKLPAAGGRLSVTPNNGTLSSVGVGGVYWTSTISGTNSRNVSFGTLDAGLSAVSRSDGMSIRCIKETVGSIGALNCGSSTLTGNLISGIAASNVSASVPYTGGNSGFYESQSISSTGVTGLTASISQGLFANGAGNLVYTISGTPSASGTASFELNIGGKTCTLNLTVVANPTNQYPVGTVFCTEPTLIVDVTNPSTGKTWMDRNLGATRAATSITDANAYGDLYQWGRRSDGHQCRTSATTNTLSSIDVPANSSFILTSTTPFDWRSPQNTNLWQGVNGVNNPCPSGYRLPTETEINAERLSWSVNTSVGAFSSPLKLSMTGVRRNSNGILFNVGSYGAYNSSTVSGTDMRYLDFSSTNAFMSGNYRALGLAIRCIKETVGSIGALNCGSSTLTGNLISGIAASNVSASVPYTGGNSGFYESQSISSTGVTGLTASISQGLFANGAGNLVYTISGTPSASGTASFELNIGGKTCTLNLTVVANPTNQYPVGTVFCTEPTLIVDVTNPSTGKTWMDRNLGATRAATSITDANAYGDLYQWGRRSDGHQCRNSAVTTTLSSTDTPPNGSFITNINSPFDWRSPQNNNLWQGVNGINNPCPNGYRLPTETELNAERTSWSSINAAGAYASPLKLSLAGYRSSDLGLVFGLAENGIYWTSTIGSTNSKSLNLYSSGNAMQTGNRYPGQSVRCIKETVGSIGALNCGSATVTGNLISGIAASNVSASVPYTGGNGGYYAAQSVPSTGVTGLTASIAQGLFTSSSGSLVYAISGTPSASGTASFELNIGGKTCTLNLTVVANPTNQYPVGTVFCTEPTLIVDVTNPSTGKTWMDRNLGATRAATSITDANAYGDLYQWGRRSDGHQCRTSATTNTLSSIDVPANSSFILTSTTPFDWRSPQNTNLWQGVNGVNNPCPSGYRLPTETEINAERLSWSLNTSIGAFATPLKLIGAGGRDSNTGSLGNVGSGGFYCSSTISGTNSRYLYFNSNSANMSFNYRAVGYSVRCLKETVGSIGALNCGSATVTGNLISGSAASSVSASVPYTGGNGGYYASQSISSTGVTGLTASISQGLFASGAGNLVYTISGTPSASGTASFVLSIGGQSCTLNLIVNNEQPAFPAGSVFCSGATIVNDVINPTTGKTWMDRNLGASQVAISKTDAAAYGDLYQWGRRSDGHQCRNSATTSTLSSSDIPANANFILAPTTPFDWRSPQNTNLWQGVNGINNPCPNDYRLPTQTELDNERLSWVQSPINSTNDVNGAFASPLKLPAAGMRLETNGSLSLVGTNGRYWSSVVSSTQSIYFHIQAINCDTRTLTRASGMSVRCIKN